MATTTEDLSTEPQQKSPNRTMPLWQRGWNLIIGERDRPAFPPPRLTLLTIVLLGGVLAFWRFTILLVSVAWYRLGVEHPWSPDIAIMRFWRYSVRWDSGWYLGISREGYFYNPDGQSSIAFFPLFPLSVRYLHQILPGTDVLAGLVIVHVALFAALIYIYQLVRLDYPEIVAWRTLFFLLIFPASFFFSAFYTESLLLLGMAGTLYHARRGQWLAAGIFGFFTGLTKLIGIVLIVPVVLELLRQRAVSRENLRPALFTAFVPMGAIGYLAYLHMWLGDFRIYFESQTHWQRQSFDPEPFILYVKMLLGNPPEIFPYPANTTPIHDMFLFMDMTGALIFIGVGIYLWFRIRPSYGALVLAGTLVPALSGNPLALTRYLAILFPAFIILARIQSEPIRNALAIVSMFGLAFTTYLFVNGFWAG
jgi:hypothetical protein